MAALARLQVRVYYEDTDFSGAVYHASYLRFMERGRTEMLRALGIQQRTMMSAKASSLGFVVRAMSIDFLRPARMDDLLTVETDVLEVGAATIEMAQRVTRDTEVLATARVRIACVLGGKAARLPPDVRSRLLS